MIKNLVVKSRAVHEAGRFGRWQIVLLCLALISVGATAFLYIQIKRAERRDAEAKARMISNRNTLSDLKRRIDELAEDANVPTPETIRTSLVRFEDDFLAPAEEAELAVVREVNRLAGESGVNLSDINFDPIEQEEIDEERAASTSQRRGESLFPGLEMSFTVEGSYTDIRRFLVGLEGSRTFLFINSLDLKSVEPSRTGDRTRGAPNPATNQVVAVGIKLSVYYQREAS